MSESLKLNTTLTMVDLGCDRKENSGNAKNEMKQKNRTVNSIESEGAESLSELLKTNTSLMALGIACDYVTISIKNGT